MSLTEAFLTEAGGLRGVEGGTNRVTEDHGGGGPGPTLPAFSKYLSFNGTTDKVDWTIANLVGQALNPHTVVFVTRRTGGSADGELFTTPAYDPGWFWIFTGSQIGYYDGATLVNGPAWAPGEWCFYAQRSYVGSPARWSKSVHDGSSWPTPIHATSSTPGVRAWPTGNVTMGNAPPLPVDIVCIARFDTALSDAQVENMVNGIEAILDTPTITNLWWPGQDTGPEDIVGTSVPTITGTTLSAGFSPFRGALAGAPTVPGAATLTAAMPGNAVVDLTWTAPASTGGSPITGYLVEKSADGTTGWSTVTTTGAVLTYQVTGLTNGTIQYFRVSAINSIGTGTASNVLNATPAAGGGGFTDPTSLPNLIGWWDASDASTFSFSSGAIVSQWRDKSGGAKHLVAGGTGPTRTAAALNGLAVVDFVESLPGIFWSGSNMLGGTTVSIFIVIRYDSSIFNHRRAISAGNASQDDFGHQSSIAIDSEGGIWPSGYRGGAQVSTPSTNQGAVWLNMDWIFNGTNNVLHLDGVAQTPAASTGTWDWDYFALGYRYRSNDEYCAMRVAEVIVYSDAKTGADLTNVQNYLGTKWGL